LTWPGRTSIAASAVCSPQDEERSLKDRLARTVVDLVMDGELPSTEAVAAAAVEQLLGRRSL
jgi:hypothetical protein